VDPRTSEDNPDVLRAVVGVALLVLALVATIGATSLAAETVTVGPGLSLEDSVLMSTEFQLDENGVAVAVSMTVSGTITLQEPGVTPVQHDAFYCFEGCDGIRQTSGLVFGHDQGTGPDIEYQPIEAFVKGNKEGNFVATPAFDPGHTYTFDFACDENSQIRCLQIRALAVPFADPAAGQQGAGAFTVSLGDGAPATQGCAAVEGRVTDQEGRPISAAHVRLESSGVTHDEGGTGTDGRYRLAVPPEAGADLRVVLLAEEFAHSPPRFKIMAGTEVIGAASPPIDPSGESCTQDFTMTGLASGITPIPPSGIDVPAAFGAYQAIDAAWTLATRMGPEPTVGLPLPVFLSCERPAPPPEVLCPVDPGVHFFRTQAGQPFIAVSSSLSSSGPADMANMLGHEFGHFFMFSAFGGIPLAPGTTNHGGYYVNTSSSDAWVEGFASFYSLMIRRQVSGQPETTVVGSAGDMEGDLPAYFNAGRWEEFAVVGILLDLSDGPGDTGRGQDRPVAAEIHLSDERDLFVAELPPDTKVGTPWRADVFSSTGSRLRSIRGAVVEFRGLRVAIGSLPDVPFDQVRLVLRPPGRANDDDAIAGDLFTLWPALFSFTSSKPEAARANNHLFDVQDLYRASQLLFGSDRDRNGNGISDVDEIFGLHGYFSDTVGGVSNRTFDAGEVAGLSSHTETTIGTTVFPAMDPRASPPVLPEMQARIDTGGVEATALVQVDFPEPDDGASFAMLVEPDAQGMVALPVPPPGSGATLSVIMLADGHEPAAALEVDPDTFWPQAEESAGVSFLTASVEMEPGEVLLGAGSGTGSVAGDGGIWVLIVGLLLFLALDVALVVWVDRRHRRTARLG
jgi:hypothetical protein